MCWLIPTFVEFTRKKLIGRGRGILLPVPLPPSWIGLKYLQTDFVEFYRQKIKIFRIKAPKLIEFFERVYIFIFETGINYVVCWYWLIKIDLLICFSLLNISSQIWRQSLIKFAVPSVYIKKKRSRINRIFVLILKSQSNFRKSIVSEQAQGWKERWNFSMIL